MYLVLILIFSNNFFGQDKVSDKNLIVYKSSNDFLSKKGDDFGKILNASSNSWGGNAIYTVAADGKKITCHLNDFWGFSIGKYEFRMNKFSLRIPMWIIKNDEKFFYMDGYLILNKAMFGTDDDFSMRDSDGYFYSDDLDSKVYEITKIIHNEKDNIKLKDLIECIKIGKKRSGIQAKFNGYSKCILPSN